MVHRGQSGMPRSKRLRSGSVVALTAVLLMAACSSSKSKSSTATTAAATSSTAASAAPSTGPGTPAPKPLAEKATVTVAIPQTGSESILALFLANQEGEFTKENLNVQIKILPVPETIVLMQQGSVDVTPNGIFAGILNADANGANLKMIAGLSSFPDSSKAGLWERSALAKPDGSFDPCSLKNKTVSFGGSAGLAATSTWWIGQYFAKCPGMTIHDVKLSTLGAGDLLAALQSGSVDAGFLPDPIWTDPQTKGYAKLATVAYKGALGGYFASPKFVAKTDVADAFVRAMVRTARTYLQGDYHHNPDPALQSAIITALGVPAATYNAGVSLVFDPALPIPTTPVQGLQEAWFAAGGILSYKAPLPDDSVVDGSVLKRVLAE
jgi:NitT/TauT family transport system substrate-binding protein